jgi:hypothetical protein
MRQTKNTLVDDREGLQAVTHSIGYGGIDTCVSGWGGAEGGTSVAIWACKPEDAEACKKAVRARGDIKTVRLYNLQRGRRPAAGAKHVHIYVWDGQEFVG